MMTAKTEFLNSGVGYCYPDNNASFIKILRPAGVSALLYILSGTLVVVAIFGNLFVIIAVSHFRQLYTPTNFFVLSLAVADFLSGVLIMPVAFAAVIDYCWYLDDAVCLYHIIYCYFLLFVSVLNLVSISVDRYFGVCDPFFYNRNITNSAVGVSITFVWLFAFFFIYTFLFHTGGLVVTDFCIGMCVFYHYTHWWIVHHVITFLLPLLIIICLYTTIFITAMRHVKAIRSVIKETKNADSKKSKTSNSSERKAAKTLGIVVITFVILCSPCFVYTSIQLFITINSINWLAINKLLVYLLTMNSCVNPIVYALFYPWFRKSLKIMATLKIFKSSFSLVNILPN